MATYKTSKADVAGYICHEISKMYTTDRFAAAVDIYQALSSAPWWVLDVLASKENFVVLVKSVRVSGRWEHYIIFLGDQGRVILALSPDGRLRTREARGQRPPRRKATKAKGRKAQGRKARRRDYRAVQRPFAALKK